MSKLKQNATKIEYREIMQNLVKCQWLCWGWGNKRNLEFWKT